MPRIGDSYTLASIGAVVLGGASIFGGRGSFIGACAGAILVIQINTVVQFLGTGAVLATVAAWRPHPIRRSGLLLEVPDPPRAELT